MTTQITINSVVNQNIPANAAENFEHPEVRAAVELFTNSINNIMRSLEQFGGITQKDVALWSSLIPSDTLLTHQLRRLYIVTSVSLVYGDFVQIYNDAGTAKVRKSNATAGSVRRAHGFCNVQAGTAAGERTEIIVGSGILSITGVVAGDDLYLGTTAGTVSTTPATGVGQLEQYIGFGVKTDVAFINIVPGTYIQR